MCVWGGGGGGGGVYLSSTMAAVVRGTDRACVKKFNSSGITSFYIGRKDK